MKQKLGVLAACAVAMFFGVAARAAETNADWQTVYDKALTPETALNDWTIVMGDWTPTADGIKKKGKDSDGLLMLRVPVVKGAVRIEYEARADADPGDLSLFFGMKNATLGSAAYFGFGSKDNSTNLIRVPYNPEVIGSGPCIATGRWHKVSILRQGGRLEMGVDGKIVAACEDYSAGYPGPYIGLYCWNEGIFRRVKIERRADPGLEAIFTEKALAREAKIDGGLFSPFGISQELGQKEMEVERLLGERLDVRQRLETDRQVVWRPAGRTPDAPTLAKIGPGEMAAVFAADREAEDDPYGKIQMVRSGNNGRDWGAPLPVADSPLSDREPGIVALKSGALLATWKSVPGLEDKKMLDRYNPADLRRWKADLAKVPEKDRAQYAGAWCALSKDGGKTWGERVRTPVHAPHGPIQLQDGRLLYLGRGEADGKPVLAAAESRDEGASWQVIWKQELTNSELLGIGNAHLAQLPDGRIVGVFTIDPRDWKPKGTCYIPNQIWQMKSDDGGKKWSVPRITPMFGNPPHLAVLKDGRLLCTYGYRRDQFKASTRAYPASQRACVSYDGGATWDYQHEIMLRGDAPDRRLGYPTSVEADDGAIVTLFSQTFLQDQETSLQRTRWQLPILPPAKAPERFKVEMGAPALVVAGPLDERRWGFYQFPSGSRKTRSGNLVAYYTCADDTYGSGASSPNPSYISRDGGKAWSKITAEDEKEVRLDFTLKNGVELGLRGFNTFKPLRAGALGLKPLNISGSALGSAEYYRYADLPAELRCVVMRRWKTGGAGAENYDAPFEFPNLAMIRYKVGDNSETGLVALPDDMVPAYLSLGYGCTCELPDGTLLTLCGATVVPPGEKKDLLWGMHLMESKDGGKSWKYRSTIMSTEWPKALMGTEEGNLVRRPNGTLLCLVRSEGCGVLGLAGGTPEAWLVRSKDDGRTWEAPERLNDYTALPRMIALPNGVVAALHGRPGIALRFANDPDCRSWTDLYYVHQPIGFYENTADKDSTCGYTTLIELGSDRFLVVYSDFYHRDADWTLHKAIKVREIQVQDLEKTAP